MACLLLKDIRKDFGKTKVLKGVDLTIDNGEFVVLVGPSGCGKSTLLRCIAGLEVITAGELHIGDRKVNDCAPKDRDIAMVFQSYALYPHMTVGKNMAFGLQIRRMPKEEIDQRVDKAAKLLGLEDLLERFPRQLSGGQRQRVAMGRAIVRQPSVFLFDEPLSNLDASLRVQMRVELARLHQRMRTTMIYVTHDQVEAMTLADRIVVMNLGEVQQVGAPLELYHRPANKFVAGFIGSPAMNFLSGEIVEAKDGIPQVKVAGGVLSLPAGREVGDVGRSVDLGIRPENLKVVSCEGASLTGRVEVVEPMGWDAHVHVCLSTDGAGNSGNGEKGAGGNGQGLDMGLGQVVIARAEADLVARLKPGDKVGLEMPPDRVHLFDSESGQAIGTPTHEEDDAPLPQLSVPLADSPEMVSES